MKTQAQIIERIRTTKDDDVFGTALLYLFVERSGQIELLGKRLWNQVGSDALHEPHTEADAGAMLADLVRQSREWKHEDEIQKIRKQRMRALVWLVDDDAAFDWTKSAHELIAEIELAYGVKPE